MRASPLKATQSTQMRKNKDNDSIRISLFYGRPNQNSQTYVTEGVENKVQRTKEILEGADQMSALLKGIQRVEDTGTKEKIVNTKQDNKEKHQEQMMEEQILKTQQYNPSQTKPPLHNIIHPTTKIVIPLPKRQTPTTTPTPTVPDIISNLIPLHKLVKIVKPLQNPIPPHIPK